jgi:hypothetical protein
MNSLSFLNDLSKAETRIEQANAEKTALLARLLKAINYSSEYLYQKLEEDNLHQTLYQEFLQQAKDSQLDLRNEDFSPQSIRIFIMNYVDDLCMIYDDDAIADRLPSPNEQWEIQKLSTNPLKLRIQWFDNHARYPEDPEYTNFIYEMPIQLNDLMMVEEPEYQVIDGMLNEWYDKKIEELRTLFTAEVQNQKAKQYGALTEQQLQLINNLDLTNSAIQEALKNKIKP